MSQRYEQFGKYLLLEKLASGGMAEIFLARAQGASGISKFVAMKRILPQFAETPEFVEMFKSEAKIAVNLNHGNIVSIYDFGIQGGQFYLIMDYVEGRNLRQILNKMKKSQGRFSVDQVVYIVKEVSSGLDHAHRCNDGSTGKPLNITHRDMSPQNIMVSFEGEVKIVDFGIAKAESQIETTRAGTLKGKFGYMSPEQAEGHVVDLRTDIFSLGIVLWELLANGRLFSANNEMNTLRKIRECQVPSLRKINPNIPVELERITMKALAKDRNLRYQTSAALHRDLNRFLNRHYPEFSTSDFSSAIKNLFSDEIYAVRQRLVEYSKLPTNDEEVSHLTNTIAPPTEPPTSLGAESSFGADSNVSQPVFGNFPKTAPLASAETKEGLDLTSKSDLTLPPTRDEEPLDDAQEIEIPSLKNVRLRLNTKPKGKKDHSTLSELTGTSARQTAQLGLGDLSQASHRTNSKPSRPPEIHPAPGITKLLSSALMISLMVCGYLVAAKFFTPMRPFVKLTDPYLNPLHRLAGVSIDSDLPSSAPNVGAPNPSNPLSSAPGTTPTTPKTLNAATEETSGTNVQVARNPRPELPSAQVPDVPADIFVASNPSGAEVLVEGVSTGRSTPTKVSVPSNRSFRIALRRSGFIDYEQGNLTLNSLEERKLQVNLQQALVGYLDIDVKPPSQVRILINGHAIIDQQLPIEKYSVPAETDVKIRAEDPIRQVFVEKIIRVNRGARSRVILQMSSAQSSDRLRPSTTNPPKPSRR